MVNSQEIPEATSFVIAYRSLCNKELECYKEYIKLLATTKELMEKSKDLFNTRFWEGLRCYLKGFWYYRYAHTTPIIKIKLVQLRIRLLLKAQIRRTKRERKPLLRMMDRGKKMIGDAEALQVHIHECIRELAPLEIVPDGLIESVNTILADIDSLQSNMLFAVKEFVALGSNQKAKELLPKVSHQKLSGLNNSLDPDSLTIVLRMLEQVAQNLAEKIQDMNAQNRLWLNQWHGQQVAFEELHNESLKNHKETNDAIRLNHFRVSFWFPQVLLVLLLAGGFWFLDHPGLRSACMIALMLWFVQSIRPFRS